jgi:hypothetical protein
MGGTTVNRVDRVIFTAAPSQLATLAALLITDWVQPGVLSVTALARDRGRRANDERRVQWSAELVIF